MTRTRFQIDRYSLRWRLPLVIVVVVGMVLAAFLWITSREVTRAALQTAGARAAVVAEQIGGSLTQSTRQRVVEARRLVSTPQIEDCLRNQSDTACQQAHGALERLPGSTPQVTELWSSNGVRLIQIAVPPTAATTMPGRGAPSGEVVGPLRRTGDMLYAEVAIDVHDTTTAATGDASAQTGPLLGYVVSRRPLTATPTRDLMNRLAGIGGGIKLGNVAGDVWTDLATAVPAPAVNLNQPGVATYQSASHVTYLGALSPIQDTPWAVWVEFPEAVVVAPARAFLYRMLAIAGVCLVAAAFLVGLLCARFIGPLSDLTELSEAIAAGDYARRIRTRRRDEVGRLGAAFNTMAERIDVMHDELETRVAQRTASLAAVAGELEQRAAELAAVNSELEAFSYSVSHDLRAPLRHVSGFAGLLNQSAGARLEATERRHLATIMDAATRMGQLIDDLLAFSRTSRIPLAREPVNLVRLVEDVRHEIDAVGDKRDVAWVIDTLPAVQADAALLRVVFVNLLSNALKYSRTQAASRIEIHHAYDAHGDLVVSVKDNGVGFDMAYAEKLFGVFQRLHRADEFEGTGIGLATVRRIIQRHGGRTWAEGVLNGGATFSFSLPATFAH